MHKKVLTITIDCNTCDFCKVNKQNELTCKWGKTKKGKIIKQKVTRTKEDLLEICLKVLHKSKYNFDIDVRKVDNSKYIFVEGDLFTHVFIEGDLFTLSFDEENEIGISFNKAILPIGAANITKELVINLSEYDLQDNIVIYEYMRCSILK